MASRLQRHINRAVTSLCRPYIRRELPGWGRLYGAAISSGKPDRWNGYPRQWVRGKLHGYEMSLDIGYWPNRLTLFLERWSDLPTQLLIQVVLQPGDTVVDIGANEGMVSLLASKIVGPIGRVISFEPNPKPRSTLEAAIVRNSISNISIYPVGLSSKTEVLRLIVPKFNPGEGSFGRPAYEPDQLETIDCQVRRGDDILRDANPRLIKMDIEGFEPFVLQGLRETIVRTKPAIIMEIITPHLRNADTSPHALKLCMDDLDYGSYRIELVKKVGRHALELKPEVIENETKGDFFGCIATAN